MFGDERRPLTNSVEFLMEMGVADRRIGCEERISVVAVMATSIVPPIRFDKRHDTGQEKSAPPLKREGGGVQ
jgi:hypothetical protein